MPVIGIPVEELTTRIGKPIGREDLLRILGEIGCDVEGYEVLNRARCARCGYVFEMPGKEEPPPRCERCNADLRATAGALEAMPGVEVVRMELLAVRPDLFDPGGLARALRGLLSIETGLPSYTVGPVGLRLRVDDTVRRERSLRPYIACAVLENASLDEDRLKILMKLQENLHWALGRDRKHASIGVYDLDSLEIEDTTSSAGCGIEYTTEEPGAYRFVPLGSEGTGPAYERTLRQILEEHPKGTAYAHLLGGFDRYPILRSVAGRVLSMPPIINSEETKVHLDSRRLFVDVTGTGHRVVNRALNILVTSLLELDPGMRLRRVEIQGATREDGSSGSEVTPDLAPQEARINVARTSGLLGFPLGRAEVRDLLLRMRHGVAEDEGDFLRVLVPAFRNDILHERDLIEDTAIAHGYGNVPQTLVPNQTVGRGLASERLAEKLRQVMIGLGLVEMVGLVLTSPEQSDVLLDRPPHPATVLVENPISTEQTQLRTSLVPGLLQTLARNRHNPLPQAIFELGDVTFVGANAETGAEERRHLAFALISPKAGFAELRALVEAVVRELGWELRLQPHAPEFLLEGRGAILLAPAVGAGGGPSVAADSSVQAGVLGEVHPRVLERLGLQNPTVVFEMAVPQDGAPATYRYLDLG
jgi:phenylalanyl-tRNA synthetase beta chain